MRRLGVDIAGVHVSLSCEDERVAETLANRWRGFLKPPEGAGVVVEIAPGTTGARPAGVEDRLAVERAGERLSIDGLWLHGEIDLASGAGRARVDAHDAPGSIENFLRVSIAHLLLPRGGFLLHAAAIVTPRGAVVAFGPSGAGKTTLASLAGSLPVVSDDLVALMRIDGELRVVPSPFRAGGAPAKAEGHPIALLARLRQGPDRLAPLSAARGAVELAASMPFVHDDAESSAMALALAAEAGPIHELSFQKGSDLSFLSRERIERSDPLEVA